MSNSTAKPPQDWLELIDSFRENRVEFLIVGAHALSFHELPRYTGDLDLFVRPSLENSERVAKSLRDFGFASLGVGDEEFAKLDRILQLGYPPVRIDIMTSISGVTFEEAWESRVEGTFGHVVVDFIGRDALLKNKLASGRPKDLDDATRLKRKFRV